LNTGFDRLSERLDDPVPCARRESADPRGDLRDAPLELLQREITERRGGIAEPVRQSFEVEASRPVAWAAR
jgi:hypothetical protein